LGAAAAIKLWVPTDLIPGYLRFLKPKESIKNVNTGIRRLSFGSVTGSFLESEKSGSLFVIRGKVRNNYPASRSYILLKGSILDGQGKVIRTKKAYAANTFTEEVIKMLPLKDLNKAMDDRFGMGNRNVDLPPGEAIPFTIVFEDLPDDISEFTVEAVSSSAGT